MSPQRKVEREMRQDTEVELAQWSEAAEIAKIAQSTWKEAVKAAIKEGSEPPKGRGSPPGIDPPPMMLALRDRLLRQADPVGEFLADVTRSDIGKRLDLKELYTRFIDWADCNGTAHVKSWTFQRLLTEKGY